MYSMHVCIQGDSCTPDECSKKLTTNGVTQPMLFDLGGQYWVKADATALKLTSVSCFDDCVEFLIYCFFVFNVSYPAQLKCVFGLFERLMKIPPTMSRSAIVDDFMKLLE